MAEIAMKAIQRLCKKIAQRYISSLSTKANSKYKNEIKSLQQGWKALGC